MWDTAEAVVPKRVHLMVSLGVLTSSGDLSLHFPAAELVLNVARGTAIPPWGLVDEWQRHIRAAQKYPVF